MGKPYHAGGSSRDLGIRGSGAGKGDADRSNRKAFVAGLANIELHPEDKTGFERVKPNVWRKVYGGATTEHERRTSRRMLARSVAGISNECSSDV